MSIDLTFGLIFAAAVLTGLLAGTSLDKAVVQLPARHRMGITGFAAFSRANDLGNGLVAYPAIGIGAALVTILAALAVALQATPFRQAWPVYISAFLALLHSFTTARAAPNMLRLRQPINDEATLAEIFNRFAKWHNIRATLQLLNFIALVWALVAYIKTP